MSYNKFLPDGSKYVPSQWTKKDYLELHKVTSWPLNQVISLNDFRDKRIQRAMLTNRGNHDIYELLYKVPKEELPLLMGKGSLLDEIISFRLKKGR